MSNKLKALGMGLLAAMAMSALAVVNASANVSGHFTSTVEHTLLVGSEGGNHTLHFSVDGGTSITCATASYSGTVPGGLVTPKTTQSVTVAPTYANCTTNDEAKTKVTVHVNGCDYVFKSNATTHGTVEVTTCDPGKAGIVITHPNCEITVPMQAPTATHLLKGIFPTQSGKELTVDVTAEDIAAQYHAGICVFLGTSHTADMNGSVTVKGTDTAGNQVEIKET